MSHFSSGPKKETPRRKGQNQNLCVFASLRLCVFASLRSKTVHQRSRDLKRGSAESAAVFRGISSLRTRRLCISKSSNQCLLGYGGILDSPRERKRQDARTPRRKGQNQNLCASASLRLCVFAFKNGPPKEPRSETRQRGERSGFLRHLFSASLHLSKS